MSRSCVISEMRAEFYRPGRDVRTRAIRSALATCGTLEARESSVTVDARITKIMSRGITDQGRCLSIPYPQPIPPNAGGYETHGRPLDPFSGGRSRELARFGVVGPTRAAEGERGGIGLSPQGTPLRGLAGVSPAEPAVLAFKIALSVWR